MDGSRLVDRRLPSAYDRRTVARASDEIGGWLERHRDDLLDFLRTLVRTPSDNPPGDCGAIAEVVEQRLGELGLEVERFDVTRPNGLSAPTVLGWLGSVRNDPHLLLNAHLDAVPPGDGWTVDPYSAAVVDGRILGRGAGVSKSDVAVYAYALGALRATLGRPERSVVLAVTSDEETGGELGPGWLLGRHGLRPRAAIVAGSTHGVVVAHNGCIRARFTIVGRSAHAAMSSLGIDVIEPVRRLLDAIGREDARLRDVHSEISGIDAPSLVVTAIDGVGGPGVTVGRVEVDVDRRVIPEESLDQVERDLRGLAGLIDTGSATITYSPTLTVPQLRPVRGQERLVSGLQAHASTVLGEAIGAHGVPIFTDGRWFSEAGIPTVLYGAGPLNPEETRGHAADENVLIDDVVAAAEIVARTVGALVAETEG